MSYPAVPILWPSRFVPDDNPEVYEFTMGGVKTQTDITQPGGVYDLRHVATAAELAAILAEFNATIGGQTSFTWTMGTTPEVVLAYFEGPPQAQRIARSGETRYAVQVRLRV